MTNDKVIALTATSERPASTISGYAMLIALVLVIALQAFGIVNLANDRISHRGDCWTPAADPDRARLLHAPTESRRGDHPVRRLPGD